MKELKDLTDSQKNVRFTILTQFLQSKTQQVEAQMVGDNLRHWKGKIFGPVSDRMVDFV